MPLAVAFHTVWVVRKTKEKADAIVSIAIAFETEFNSTQLNSSVSSSPLDKNNNFGKMKLVKDGFREANA